MLDSVTINTLAAGSDMQRKLLGLFPPISWCLLIWNGRFYWLLKWAINKLKTTRIMVLSVICDARRIQQNTSINRMRWSRVFIGKCKWISPKRKGKDSKIPSQETQCALKDNLPWTTTNAHSNSTIMNWITFLVMIWSTNNC